MIEIESIRGLLDQVLTVSVREKASDVYIKAGKTPMLRIEGTLIPIECAALTPEMIEHLAMTIMPQHQKEKFERFNDANFIYDIENVSRFRVNAYRQKGSVAMVMRRVEDEILEFETLGLPDILSQLAMQKRGLVLCTGPTGSGKSTSLASMIKYRKDRSTGHIVTLEDPIEYLHDDQETCIVSQREIGQDVMTFKEGLESAVRQAPDVLLVGEMRDPESVQSAVYFAETGHLVLSTLHANNAYQTIERIMQFFPEDMQAAVLAQISLNLRGIIAQRLIPGVDGKRVVACEVLIGNARMAELIRAGQLTQMKRELDMFHPEGMQSFDFSLISLYRAGRITAEEALRNSDNANDLRLKLKSVVMPMGGPGGGQG
jgi:twitching motility protein PilU